ncbi:MAG: DUF4405 domain-containing protein [Syntrophomonadaceae bacterium]|jgi:hypothetical protein|nr:DUF4405 domain-containing protein [Syntrophomonadaceae bacterium]
MAETRGGMKIKKTSRILVDMSMTVLFFLMMAYHLIGDDLHEWLGATLFALFILHNILNRKWYGGLFKGKYTAGRLFQTAVNVLLLAAMVGMMISGMMLSHDVFGFLDLNAGMLGRRLHMICGVWVFVLMSSHLGLHWALLLGASKKRAAKWTGSKCVIAVSRIAVGLSAAYGIYAFAVRRLWQRMFLLIDFVFFDFEEPTIRFFVDYIAMLTLFAAAAYYFAKLLRKQRKH